MQPYGYGLPGQGNYGYGFPASPVAPYPMQPSFAQPAAPPPYSPMVYPGSPMFPVPRPPVPVFPTPAAAPPVPVSPLAAGGPFVPYSDPEVPSRSIWLGCISSTLTEDSLRQTFGQHGNVEAVVIVRPKGMAFIDYFSLEDAVRAKAALHGRLINGVYMNLKFARYAVQTVRAMLPQLIGPPPAPTPPPLTPLMAAMPGLPPLPPTPTILQPPTGAAAAVPTPPPEDTEQRKLIEKFAEYYTRNGDQFEKVTLQKQGNNPKFMFLRPGYEGLSSSFCFLVCSYSSRPTPAGHTHHTSPRAATLP
eukprot:TRINITY_DN14130_c0_g1_i1.p1 TRINITY_DN14130_c0_g1~~TRINITY_DN14130_c0_g1_i1.p1  ORF type:complete len:304 (+),score=30.29 TRINITY_DN14130_c0_g1_i1:74-985(+)